MPAARDADCQTAARTTTGSTTSMRTVPHGTTTPPMVVRAEATTAPTSPISTPRTTSETIVALDVRGRVTPRA